MPEFIASLPLVGYDGTMRHRLRGEPVAGQAHIKTGSLDEVRSVAGYVQAASGKMYVVVCLINHANAAAGQPAQDALLQWVFEKGLTVTFIDKLSAAWTSNDSLLCVGLDPDISKFPAEWKNQPDAILAFCKGIIDATADMACSFKPQIAYFAALRAEDQLEEICSYIRSRYSHIPIVLDAKRGDIGATAEQYAREAFERYGADAVTVSPYMGFDSVAPYLEWKDRGAIVLCRTSNAGGSDLQFLKVDGVPLYQHVARLVADKWNTNGQCGLVVGATFPEELAQVRAII
eukprot:gene33753-39345_t